MSSDTRTGVIASEHDIFLVPRYVFGDRQIVRVQAQPAAARGVPGRQIHM